MIAFGLVFAQIALAQEEEIYTPRLLPDSPFYFFKTIKEKIELFLAQTPEAEAEKYAELATRRIAEAKQLINKGKPEFVERLIAKHKEHLDQAEEKIEEAKEKGRDVERILVIVAEATSIHQRVLVEVYEKVPDQAKSAIEHAIMVSRQGQEKALEAVSKEKREELRQHFEQRMEKKKKECVCLTLWQPVCGVDAKTYTNECWLGCAGVEKAYDGECRE